jgi:hypothetical protein
MFLAIISLITGLAISAVAIYYSVIGLTAIFAAAAIPIMVMGVTLEIAKLVATVWLKQNWDLAPRLMKLYLVSAVMILMFITSMGIFGFLSKAHLDQSMVSGDVVDKVAIIDAKIQTQKDNMEASRKALKQMDESVDQVMSRSNDEKGADKAVQLRRSQAKERQRLQQEISTAQTDVSKLQNERAPIAKELRKVEAEVGPIKYIASFVYGSAEQSILEKAVTWLIIVIVIVFDPLAVILLLASQYSFAFAKREKLGINIEEDAPSIVQQRTKFSDYVANKITSTKSSIYNFFAKIKGAVVNPVNKESTLDPKGVEDTINKETITDFEGIKDENGNWVQTGPGFIVQELTDVVPEAVFDIPTPEQQKSMLEEFVEAVKSAENVAPVLSPIQGFDVPKVSETHDANIKSLQLTQPPVMAKVLPVDPDEIPVDDLDAWNKMIEAAEAEVIKSQVEEPKLKIIPELQQAISNRDKNKLSDVIEPLLQYGNLTPEHREEVRKQLLTIQKDMYIQNEEQVESNLWQETRKQVEEENKEHISQIDYQEKVKDAIVKRLVKNLEDGLITIEEMTAEEAEAVEQYLQRELNDRQNNPNQST